ncbi:hypothetical protein METHP14_10293 [Pseudomonas sp. P14-2025]
MDMVTEGVKVKPDPSAFSTVSRLFRGPIRPRRIGNYSEEENRYRARTTAGHAR